ncbi:keratin, type I cytoskeletal 19-like [Genypterus blacodes]|uniref:keratin, type I cytoskeletal 19-like n=1 Tax=Genypterus blacodes TaxID=154954 RepID=UPI003F76B350
MSAFSSRSNRSSTSVLSVTRGSQVRSRGQSHISNASPVFSVSRSPSMYGGAGGYGTRVSQAQSDIFSAVTLSGDAALCSNEKMTMQNLNDRLASYLEKVSSLETANRNLELQIKEFNQKSAPVSRDLSGFYATISDLQAQILVRLSKNQDIVLDANNFRLTADDFKIRYETELSMRMVVDADVARLQGVTDSLTRDRTDLQMHLDVLEEELMYMKKNQKEEMEGIRARQGVHVNVEMNCAESADLPARLDELREQYAVLIEKNKQEMETWSQKKMLATSSESCIKDLKTFSTVLSDTQRTYQSLEIALRGLLTHKHYQEQNLAEDERRYSAQLSQLQLIINTLEAELQQLTVGIQEQATEYKMLLDIKMRLELEIAEYRRLLGGDTQPRVVISKMVEEVEEIHKHHNQKIIKTIVEEVIDGKVISSSVDTQVVEMQSH